MSRSDMLPLWTDAYLADTMHLNNEQHGCYLKLLIFAWRQSDCRIKDDNLILKNVLGVSPKKLSTLKPILMSFWELKDGYYSQKRLSKEHKKRRDYIEGQKAKYENSREERNFEDEKSSETYGNFPNENNEGARVADADADVKEHTKVCSTAPKKKRRRKKSALPLPENWKPKPLSPEMKTKLNLTPEEVRHEFEKFKTHAAANDRRQVDWQASWRAWLISDFGTYGRRLAGKSGQNSNGANASGNGSQASGLGGAYQRQVDQIRQEFEIEGEFTVRDGADEPQEEFRLGFDKDA